MKFLWASGTVVEGTNLLWSNQLARVEYRLGRSAIVTTEGAGPYLGTITLDLDQQPNVNNLVKKYKTYSFGQILQRFFFCQFSKLK